MRQSDKSLIWEIAFFVVVCIVITLTIVGCVGVDPASSMGDATITPALTAEQIQTAVQTAINNNSSVVNDLWPVVVMLFVGVIGIVSVKFLNAQQTKEVKDHISKNGH